MVGRQISGANCGNEPNPVQPGLEGDPNLQMLPHHLLTIGRKNTFGVAVKMSHWKKNPLSPFKV